jgi:uracil-DNA glycosylase
LLRRVSDAVRVTKPTAAAPPTLTALHEQIAACERCPRLREYCKGIGERKRRAYVDQTYWARPVPGFGDPKARVLTLGLAPGAHGGNRTGRIFTGDGSGYFLYPVLHDAGFANQPNATHIEDGLRLRGIWISAVVHCAPPGDKPTPEEIRTCAPHLADEIALLPEVRVVVCLGKVAWDGYLAHLARTDVIQRRAPFVFGHGAQYELPNGITLVGSYHPSLRNTNTGKLNRAMLLRIFMRARQVAGLDG